MQKLFLLPILFAFAGQLKGQTTNIDKTNKYVALVITRNTGDFSMEVFLDNNQYINLYKSLSLDTLKLPDGKKDYTYILKGLNYMDKQGYELVSSSANISEYAFHPITREYIFRKKITYK